MSPTLQERLDGAAAVLKLQPNDEFEGPLYVRRPVTLDGQGANLVAFGAPALFVEAKGVVLRRMRIAAGDPDQAPAIRVAPGAGVRFEDDVEVRGDIEGIAAEAGHWEYDSDVALGPVIPGLRHLKSIRVTVPVACRVESRIQGVDVQPARLSPGPNDLRLSADLKPGTALNGRIFLVTAGVRRAINLTGFAAAEARPDGFSPRGASIPLRRSPYQPSVLPAPDPRSAQVHVHSPPAASVPGAPQTSLPGRQAAPLAPLPAASTSTGASSAPVSRAPTPGGTKNPRRLLLGGVALAAMAAGVFIVGARSGAGKFTKVTSLSRCSDADAVRSLAVSPSGGLVALGSDAGTVKVADTKTSEARWRASIHAKVTSALAFSRDGALLASGGDDGRVWLWDAANGEFKRKLSTGASASSALAVSDSLLAVACENGDVSTYRLQDGAQVWLRSGKHDAPPRLLAFSRDGSTLVSAGEDNKVIRWNAMTGDADPFRGFPSPATALAVSREGAALAAGAENGSVYVWQKENPQPKLTVSAHSGIVRGLYFYDDELGSVGDDAHVVITNLKTGKPVQTLSGDFARARRVAFSDNGDVFGELAPDGPVGVLRLE